MSDMQKLDLNDDKSLLDVELIHDFLCNQSYWNKGISLSRLVVALEHSLCIGAYLGGKQIAFCRVVSDYATYAHLLDVFVVPEYRGNGIAKAMLRFVMTHPHLQNMRRFALTTRDGQELYRQFGFDNSRAPENYMEIYNPDIYLELQEE